ESGTPPPRRPHRHRRAHPEGARLVARRRHDAPALRAPAHCHRPPAQPRVVAALVGGVEGVHVEMDDLAHTVYIATIRAASLALAVAAWKEELPRRAGHGPGCARYGPRGSLARS